MRFSLRLKLTLVSLLLLIIPFIGFRFSEIITRDLVESRRETLLFSARAVASALTGRTGLFDQELFHALDQRRDLYLFHLTNPIRLNGKSDDWLPQLHQAEEFAAEHLLRETGNYRYESLHFQHMLGVQGEYLYAIFVVTDDHVVYRPSQSLAIDGGDHLQIAFESQDGAMRQYLVSTDRPGWVNGFLMPEGADEMLPVIREPRIQGMWAETAQGYLIELRLPRELIGERFAFAIADVDDEQSRQVTSLIGTASPDRPEKLGWLLSPSKSIEHILKSLDRPQSRILIVDANQRVRASYGSLALEKGEAQPAPPSLSSLLGTTIYDLLRPLYRMFTTPFTEEFKTPVATPTTLDISGIKEGLKGKSSITRYRIADGRVEVMAAIAPLMENTKVIGAVVVEQTTNSILALQNRVIEEALSFTILAFCCGSLVLLVFASRLSYRIRQLRDQARGAISETGEIRGLRVRTRARDEIGDLARTLNTMLGQLRDQTIYRETMADNLEHEMRTPLAGISASLKNLRGELDNPDQRIRDYLDWALSDVVRLEQLMAAIRDATSLQQALDRNSHEDFDLARALQLWLSHSWQPAFPEVTFHSQQPEEELIIHGDPGRIRQLLDKLIENAVSFHRDNTPIPIDLSREGRDIVIRVTNEGQPIPEELRGQLFNAMVSHRQRPDNRPHLGLGLYVARTICQHHRGTISAENLSDGRQGVVFTVRLPAAAG